MVSDNNTSHFTGSRVCRERNGWKDKSRDDWRKLVRGDGVDVTWCGSSSQTRGLRGGRRSEQLRIVLLALCSHSQMFHINMQQGVQTWWIFNSAWLLSLMYHVSQRHAVCRQYTGVSNEPQRRTQQLTTRCSITMFSNLFYLFSQNRTPTLAHCHPITHQQHVLHKYPFVSVAHPIKRKQVTNYNR